MKKLPINPPITFTSLPRRSSCHAVTDQRRVGEGGFVNLRVLFGLLVMLAGVFVALLSFDPATTGFAQGTTREQMAVALAQALAIQPPACVPGQEMFNDVPASSPFCPFIEDLARRGITGGCGGGNYCPGSPVSRAQMAVFIFKATEAFHVVGANNTAAGTQALQSLTTGNANTAVGAGTLVLNEADGNTAVGAGTLVTNTTGDGNTANGAFALFNNTVSRGNTGVGAGALGLNDTTGNTGVGAAALGSNTTGGFNTAIGRSALKSNTKDTPQFGLIAEEVAAVNPDLVVRDKKGDIYTVRYDAVNAMLLNEFLKEHRKNEEQEATIARQQKQIEALTAGLQKVSAQLEASKPAPQVVNNP